METTNERRGNEKKLPVKRSRKRVRRIRWILYVMMIAWIIFGVIGMITSARWIITLVAEASYGRENGGSGSQVFDEDRAGALFFGEGPIEEKQTGSEGESGETITPRQLTEAEKEACRRVYAQDQNLLVLVNKEHELSGDYSLQLRSICSGRLQAADVMYEDLVEMLKAAGDAGYQYWIASGYRSRERQQELINEDVADYMEQGMSYEDALAKTLEETQPAGYSEHETGLALDILCSTNTQMNRTQAGEPGNHWLTEYSAEYGFILRYPKDKETVTGIAFEPWHFRYVGKEAAGLMKELDLTLEEFYEIVE